MHARHDDNSDKSKQTAAQKHLMDINYSLNV